MSLYIGKDNNNNRILSISRMPESETNLKTPNSYGNIAFHSKYPLLGVYSDELYNTTYVSSYSAYGDTWNRYLINIPTSVLSAIVNNGDKRVAIFYRTGSTDAVTVFNPIDSPNITSGVDVLRYTNGKYYLTTSNSVSTIRIVILDYTVSGNYVGSVLFNMPISITADSLLINGEDYFRKKFLVTPNVNTIDTSIMLVGSSFQVINSVPSLSGLELIANSTTTTISFGGKAIISSIGTYKQLFGQSFLPSVTKSFTIPTGFSTVSTIATGLPTGSEIISVSITPNDIYPDSVVNVLMGADNSTWIPVLLGFFPTQPDGQPGNYITSVRLLNGSLQSKSEITAMGGDSPGGSVGVINGFVTYAIISR